MCQGCHGIVGWRTAFPEVYRVPKLSGQNPQYIVAALKQYKSGDRGHPSMRAIAASLTDADMANIAAYYSQDASDHGGQMTMNMRTLALAGRPRGAHVDCGDRPPTSTPARRRCRKSAPRVTASTARRPRRRITRSSPGSIPITSRRRCATTSRARARTRSWPGFAQGLTDKDIENVAAVFLYAAEQPREPLLRRGVLAKEGAVAAPFFHCRARQSR